MKVCTKCNEEKPLSEFHKNHTNKVDGHNWSCKSCIKEYQNQPEVKARLKQNRKRYFSDNRERERESNRKWRENNLERWRKQRNEYYAKRRKVDPAYRLSTNLRNRLNKVVKHRSKSALKLTGCDIHFLVAYLEDQFKDGMSWDNYGEWHIDHIKPLCSFNLEDENEQLICFHYSNLQPLWAIENLRKGAR